MTKKFLMGGVALLTLGGVATAADLRVVPNKAPPYLASPAAFNWSGLYIGAEAGYAISSIDLNTVGINSGIDTDAGSLGPNASGGVGGLTLAFRNQPLGSPFVFGIKGAFDFTGINSSGSNSNLSNLFAAAPVGSVSIPWDGRVVGEIGYAITPQVLLFVDGGGAFGDIKTNGSATGCTKVYGTACDSTGTFAVSTENIHWGWTGGAGIKYALAPNFILGFEWNYVNLGHQGVTLNTTPSGSATTTAFNFDNTAAYNKFLGTVELKF